MLLMPLPMQSDDLKKEYRTSTIITRSSLVRRLLGWSIVLLSLVGPSYLCSVFLRLPLDRIVRVIFLQQTNALRAAHSPRVRGRQVTQRWPRDRKQTVISQMSSQPSHLGHLLGVSASLGDIDFSLKGLCW